MVMLEQPTKLITTLCPHDVIGGILQNFRKIGPTAFQNRISFVFLGGSARFAWGTCLGGLDSQW